ncbi:MAG TPA: NUDIX hydrolase [Blastocatellia bacterium]|nr:NUDIX hydrolase [Blastocatellia bacterium]
MAHELVNRQYLYRGKIFDVSLGRFRSQSKGDVDIEIVHHNGGAAAIPVFKDGSVALVRQWRYPIAKFTLEIAAGRIEPGQTPQEAAARELEEELGYRARHLTKLCEFNVAPGYCEERIHIYLATRLEESVQDLDDDEEIEVVKMPLDEALALVRSGEIDDAKSIIGLTRAREIIR